MPDLSEVIQYLNAISAVAVLLGVVFIVFQLRQNAMMIQASNRMAEEAGKQVEASLQQNRANTSLGIVERATDESFTRRRKAVRDIVKKFEDENWKVFLETGDDFEVRAFGNFYEYIAYLARTGVVDLKTLEEALGYRITFDWEAFAPAAIFYRQAWGKNYIFANFEWLAGVTKTYLEGKERTYASEEKT